MGQPSAEPFSFTVLMQLSTWSRRTSNVPSLPLPCLPPQCAADCVQNNARWLDQISHFECTRGNAPTGSQSVSAVPKERNACRLVAPA